MSQSTKQEKRFRLKRKIRMKVTGTPECPRLSVYRSNNYMYAQLIDDVSRTTIGQASDVKATKGTKTERAQAVGVEIAKVGTAKGITTVVFDRNGFKYTGRIKLLADSARKGGLTF